MTYLKKEIWEAEKKLEKTIIENNIKIGSGTIILPVIVKNCCVIGGGERHHKRFKNKRYIRR